MQKKQSKTIPIPLEHEEQCIFVEWWDLSAQKYKCVPGQLFAVPNGSYKSRGAAVKFKCEGLRAGVPDLFLAVPVGKYSGLFIEMKRRKGGVVSADQKYYQQILTAAGYQSIIARGADAAIDAARAYLEGKS